jgi:RHS repeat-associated protein
MIAEGSDSVFIDTFPAARKDDKLTCSAAIVDGSPNVFFGGNKTQYLDIADDVEWWETALEIGIGLLMGKGKLPGKIACMALGAVAGKVGEALGSGFRSMIGYPVNPATGGKVLDGDIDTDFVLPGPLPIEWRRFYNSHDARADMPLGRGWGLPYTVDLRLVHAPDGTPGLVFSDHQGRPIDLPLLEPGHALFNTAEGFTLARMPGGHLEITTTDLLRYQFGAPPTMPGNHTLKLLRLVDRNGNWLRFRYDTSGRLAIITDTLGRVLRLRYEHGHQVSAIDLETPAADEAAGRLVSYRYDGNGQLAQVTDRLGTVTRGFAYQDGLMTQHVLPGGLACHYAWQPVDQGSGPDGDRRVVRHWTSDGEAWDIQYRGDDAGGGTTVAIDQLGRRETWAWDRQYNLTGYTNPLGHTWAIEWNESRDPLSVTRPDGSQWRYGYDDNGLRILETDPLGRSVRIWWNDTWYEPRKIVEPDGALWQYEYDDKGNLTVETAPDGTQTITAYDSRGLPIHVTDARGGQKHLAWNPRAQLASYTDCSGKTTRYEYDGAGHLTRVTDALGQVTELKHTAVGQLVTARLPDNATETWRYDAAGRLVGAVDALARETRYALDIRGRLVRKDDAAGRSVAFAYDQAQRLAQLVPEGVQPYDFSYDDADRLIEETRPDGTRLSYEYDAASNVIAVTHHPGIGDDVFTDLELGETKPSITGPRRTELSRDAAGQLVEKRCGPQLSRYRYDMAGRLVEAQRLELPASDTEGVVPPRLTLAEAPEPRLLHSVRLTYDVQGQIVTETSIDHVRGETHTLRHEHDALGNRIRTDLPDLPGRAARSLHYLHYGSGHLHQVRLGLGQASDGTPTAWQIVADFERDDLHREILRSQGSLKTRFMLDPLGRRLGSWTRPDAGFGLLPDNVSGFNSAQGQGPSLVEGLTKAYRYDPTGELRESRHGFKGGTRFDYDPTGRVDSVVRVNRAGQSQAEHFAYDPAGNLLDAQTPVGRGYVRDNRVRVFEDKRFAYDGHGRLIEKRSGKHTRQMFLWDDEDRLVEVTTLRQPGTADETRQSVHFGYDALGRRILKEDAFGATRFIWEGMRLIEERRGAHATAYLYEPGSYVPLARVDTSAVPGEATEEAEPSSGQAEVLYFHTDPSGMPEELSDSRGHIRWRAAYKTWGNTLKETWEAVGLDGRPAEFQRSEARPANEALPIEQNLRFQGQYLDRDTGLHYNTFRYYDPDIGRFISPDPIGLNGGANLYSYAPNPVSWIDPWGLNKADWKLFDANGNIIDQGEGWRPDRNARNIPGRTGDTEQKILRHVEGKHGPNLKGSTLVVESQKSFIPIGKGRWAPVEGMAPCPSCNVAMDAFSKKHGMDIEYKYKGKTATYKGKC